MRVKRLVPLFVLKRLILRNYAAREAGKLPDGWYWADVELLRRGWTALSMGREFYFKRLRY